MVYMEPTTQEPTMDQKCLTCQYHDSVMNGTATREQRNHWSLWGCTCDPQAEADALAFMDLVTR